MTWRELTERVTKEGLMDIEIGLLHVVNEEPEDKDVLNVDVFQGASVANSCCD
jgi:hypothetical protein